MWLLEHENLFEGRKTWLRPGSQYLFGRTSGNAASSTDGKQVLIQHKAVSRQHMMLKVLDVQPGDGTKLHARSQVEITDLSCRQGTTIDGERKLMSKKGEAKEITEYDKAVLTGVSHTIRLAINYPEFKITWHPVVFTFASKEGRSLAPHLHTLDIKTSQEFIHGQTTHVVALKRNTPRVLQGLLAGVHIVTKGYLEAVKSATTVQNTDPNNYRASKLEEDFDTWWPKEKDYIPPMGTEPVPRPEQMLEPDPGRSDVFSGFSFIFLTEDQYTSLQEVVNSGGGKALLFDLRFGETTVEEYVEYVRSVAGQKRRSKSSNGFLPVITIRVTNYPEGSEDWCTDFHMGVDQALQQRSLQQNAFLDAILIKDVTSMQMRPTELEPMSSLPEAGNEEPASQSRGPATRPRSLSVAPEPKQEPEKAIPRKRPMRRAITQSRFTGFDDYEPPPKVRKIEEDTIMEDVKPTQPSQNAYVESQPPVPPTQASRRYESQHSVRETVEEVEEQEELFPAAAAIKKRRAATRGLSEAAESGPAPVPVHTKTKGEKVLEQLQRAKRKVGKDIDVREQTRLQLQEAEERRKADEASLREALEGVDINDIRGLVQVEDMEVRAPRQRQNAGGRNRAGDEGWNPDWNGRKNFKKFRRRGAERGPLPQKVIVALLEVPQKKGFGLGEPFFLEETAEKSRERGEERPERREREREKPKTAGARKAWSQDVDVDVDGESSPEQGFTRRKRGQNQNHNREVINVEDSEIDEEDTFPDSVGTLSGRTQRVAETQPEATLETEKSQSQTLRKRARVSVAGQPPNKRSRTARLEEDSDAEEGGFRLRRRR